MKTAGIILIIFSGTGLGLCKSMELGCRVRILENLFRILLLLKGEIRCTGSISGGCIFGYCCENVRRIQGISGRSSRKSGKKTGDHVWNYFLPLRQERSSHEQAFFRRTAVFFVSWRKAWISGPGNAGGTA